MVINHETPIIMEIKCPLFSINQSKSKEKELQNYEIKSCNSSHHAALISLMPINLPNGHQKPINRRSFQREGVRKNHLKGPEKMSENYHEEFSAKRSSLTLKKLCCKFYKVIEVRWGASPPKVSLLLSNMA